MEEFQIHIHFLQIYLKDRDSLLSNLLSKDILKPTVFDTFKNHFSLQKAWRKDYIITLEKRGKNLLER